uniref:F-box domain-containing protein n=1 Tax=Aegilops tauschii TaxID=37682 RepID=N1R065_AEGTA
MQSTSKLCVASASAQPAVLGFDGWADLPDGPLSSILALSGSFRDVLAFAATCRSWRAAFSSYPSKSTFCNLHQIPASPRQFNARVQAPDLPSNNGCQKLRTCKVIDPINKNIALRCQIPREIYQKMQFAGTSYGQLICCRAGYCLVVDVFSGAKVSPPRLPFTGDCEREFYFYVSGTPTAPLASPNSHLLVSTAAAVFDWSVGSDSWSVLQLSDAPIEKIVEFNHQFITMDDCYKIYTMQLSPLLGLQEITTEWVGDLAPSSDAKPWLVVCGNMLLTV